MFRRTGPNGSKGAKALRRAETVSRVLETSLRLFREKGFNETSLADIGAETRLSPRGVIVHFSSKIDILAALLRQELEHRSAEFAAVRWPGRTASARLAAIFGRMAKHDGETLSLYRIAWAYGWLWSAKTEEAMATTIAGYLAPVRDAVAQGVRNGEIRGIDTDALTQLLWTTYLAKLREVAVAEANPEAAADAVRHVLGLLRP